MSEEVGKCPFWKFQKQRNFSPFLETQISFVGREVFPGRDIRPHTNTNGGWCLHPESNDPPREHSWFLLPGKSWLIRPPSDAQLLQASVTSTQLPSKSNVTQRCIWRRVTFCQMCNLIKMFLQASQQKNLEHSWTSQNSFPRLFMGRLHHYTLGHLWLCWTI